MKPLRFASHGTALAVMAFALGSTGCSAQQPPAERATTAEKPTPTAIKRPQHNLPLEQIKLPPGFKIDVYAANVQNARAMVLSPSGTLFVGSRQVGNVYALRDANRDNYADEVITVLTGLELPTGIDFRDGALWVAEPFRVLRYDDIEKDLKNPPQPVVVTTNLPRDRGHEWRYMRFGPDGWLYIGSGAPGNIVERLDEPRYSTILRMQPDGSRQEIFAHGVRNTVGFDWHPVNKQLWFTDNGRDWMGDDLPPCELNHAPRKGMHFGYPYRHGIDIVDPKYGAKPPAGVTFTPATLPLGPHTAPLGMRFYTGSMFPAQYRNQPFIAERGSWNRSVPIGYRITTGKVTADGKASDYTVFAEGWLQNGRAWGRPTEVLVMPDGALLVADDTANAIYRISYEGKR